MLWRAILGTCVFLSLTVVDAYACTCTQAQPGTCAWAQSRDMVFLGTATKAEIVQAPKPGAAGPGGTGAGSTATLLIRYRFRVEEVFSGPESSEIDVFSGGDDGDCGYRFQTGGQYIVFPQKETDERLFVTRCSDTRPASDGAALLPQLRAMRKGQRIASVFGVLQRSDPPFLAPAGDPDDPMPQVALELRSQYDRFRTNTDDGGVYSFYDVHAGTYSFTANLPAHTELTQKSLTGGLPPFKIPNGACYEYDVYALPTGHVEGTVYGPDGKPLKIASLELYRADEFAPTRPGLWGFQGAKGIFEFNHVGAGDYLLVYNRLNRMDPNSPFPLAFYPGVSNLSDAQLITLKDGQDLTNLKMKLDKGYPTHQLRVHLKWTKERPLGTVTVEVKAEQGNNPSAEKIADGLWEFTLLDSGDYSVAAYEELRPQRTGEPKRGTKPRSMSATVSPDCALPPRVDTASVHVSGSDTEAGDIVLVFPEVGCGNL